MNTKQLIITATLAGMLSSPLALAAPKQAWEYDPERNVFFMIKDDGTVTKRKMVKKPRIKLVDRDGNVSRSSVNELAAGAKVLKLKRNPTNPDKIKTVVLREKSSGSSDCSFDALDYKDLEGPEDFDWDCSTDLETEEESISKSCSFDGSMDFGEGDSSMDVSGDCSYDHSTPTSNLSWDCSFDASTSASGGSWGGDADGDASFSCSWSSNVELAGPLWVCDFDPDAMSFVCASEAMEQEFGATFSPEAMALLTNFDFQPDHVDDSPEVNAAVGCSDDGGGSYSCSYEAPGEEGDCSMDFSIDMTNGQFSGDLSGDVSFSCSYDVID